MGVSWSTRVTWKWAGPIFTCWSCFLSSLYHEKEALCSYSYNHEILWLPCSVNHDGLHPQILFLLSLFVKHFVIVVRKFTQREREVGHYYDNLTWFLSSQRWFLRGVQKSWDLWRGDLSSTSREQQATLEEVCRNVDNTSYDNEVLKGKQGCPELGC